MKLVRGTKRESVETGGYDLEGKLTDVIALLQCKLLSVPKEHRASTTIEVRAYDDYGSPSVNVEIEYDRPETDAEFEARCSRQEAYDRHQADKERAEFERLKAKFGS